MSSFHVGQKVEYIGHAKRTLRDRLYSWRHPEPGREFSVGEKFIVSGVPSEDCILLAGEDNKGNDYWEDGFLSECFRPVVERSTDISIFQQLLNPSPVLAKEPV